MPTAADLRAQIDTTKPEAQWQAWIDEYGQGQGPGQYDPGCPPGTPFHTSKKVTGGDPGACVDHPDACPPGTTAWGASECVPPGSRPHSGGGPGGGGLGGGGGAPGGGPGGFGGFGPTGPAPGLDLPEFQPPTYEEALDDPGYRFAVDEGRRAIERSASARGTLRTGGTLKDILDFGQRAAAQQYGDVFNRAAATYGLQTGALQSEFAPDFTAWQTRFGGGLGLEQQRRAQDLARWQTRYGGRLQRGLQREQNIYNLLSAPPPAYPGAY